MKSIKVTTKSRCQFVDITREIDAYVKESGILNGVITVYVPHTTAGITVNENADPDVVRDLVFALSRTVPNQGFLHGEGNSDAHMKALLTGFSLQIIIEKGKLMLGTWQGVYFCEYDGPRTRSVFMKILE